MPLRELTRALWLVGWAAGWIVAPAGAHVVVDSALSEQMLREVRSLSASGGDRAGRAAGGSPGRSRPDPGAGDRSVEPGPDGPRRPARDDLAGADQAAPDPGHAAGLFGGVEALSGAGRAVRAGAGAGARRRAGGRRALSSGRRPLLRQLRRRSAAAARSGLAAAESSRSSRPRRFLPPIPTIRAGSRPSSSSRSSTPVPPASPRTPPPGPGMRARPRNLLHGFEDRDPYGSRTVTLRQVIEALPGGESRS